MASAKPSPVEPVPTALSPFAEIAPTLQACGFVPIPIVPPSVSRIASRGKAPGHTVAGHWQCLPGWQKFRECPPSAFQMGLWMKAADAGCGILTGTAAGKHPATGEPLFLVGLDFDVDGDALDALIRATPATAMAKRGAVGLTKLLRSPASIVSSSYDRTAEAGGKPSRLCDLLAAGRQTVVPGSRHVSGHPYAWIGDGPVPVDTLPVFDDEDLAALEEVLEQLGWERPASSSKQQTGPKVERGRGDYADDWAETNGESLARLNEWFAELGLPRTRQTRSECWTAVPIWRESCTGRPTGQRKANLSASSGQGGVAPGIRDWGASGADASLTAIDLVQRALSVSAGEAKDWLREKLGLDDGGVLIDLRPPTANDETPPPSGAKEGSGAAVCEMVTGKAVETLATAPQRETHAGPSIPAHLIVSCPGLLGGIAAFITDTARKPQPALALAAALTILGTAAGRRYSGPTYSGTHLYAVLCGGSGVGKDHPLDMVARILEAADMGQHVGPGEFMSFQAAYKALARQPLLLSAMDELGSFLGRLSRRGAAGNEAALTGVLRSAWGKSFAALPVPGWATQDVATIYAPALSILGASTPDEFFSSLESGSIESGFLNRWLLFPTFIRPEARRPLADKFSVPVQIIEGLKAIYNVGGAMANATMHAGRCDKPIVRVEWDGGDDGPLAREFYAWAAQIDEQSDKETLFARVAEQSIRVATIRAIGSDATAPMIDRACFEWSRELVIWSTRAMVSQSADFMAETQFQADRARVLRAIKKAGTISHRDLTRALTVFRARELEEIVKVLVGAELVTETKQISPTNGKATKRYTYIGGE